MGTYNKLTRTSNTLWNDSNKPIAYGIQLQDADIDWDAVDPNQAGAGETAKYKLPQEFMGVNFRNNNQFQTILNDFFLKHYVEFHNFLEEKDLDPSTINTWKELEEFLTGIEDSEAYTLLSMLEYLEQQSGHLYIGMSDEVPGMLQATATTSAISIVGSHIDEETGIIKMVYSIG
jgi:hypothetical protein